MRNVIRRLKHERRKQNRLISTYSGMLRRHNPELAARVYIEEESGDLQLLSQAEVDEGILASAGDFQAELMDTPAVKSLFGLKKHKQLYTTESKDINGKEPKVRIDTKQTPSSVKDTECTLGGCTLEDNPMGGFNSGEDDFPGGSAIFGVMKQLDIETISIEEGLTS